MSDVSYADVEPGRYRWVLPSDDEPRHETEWRGDGLETNEITDQEVSIQETDMAAKGSQQQWVLTLIISLVGIAVSGLLSLIVADMGAMREDAKGVRTDVNEFNKTVRDFRVELIKEVGSVRAEVITLTGEVRALRQR
jgi:hypothetical protein